MIAVFGLGMDMELGLGMDMELGLGMDMELGLGMDAVEQYWPTRIDSGAGLVLV